MTDFEKDSTPTETDFSTAFSALRNQANAHGIDPNDDKMREFLIHTANVMAGRWAENRALYKQMHHNMA